MLLDDDVVPDGQAELSPFTGRLCRKEPVEQLLLHLRGYAVPLSRILISTLLPRFLVGDQAVPIFGPNFELLDSPLFGLCRVRRIDEPDERCRRPLETADFPGTDLDVTLQ